MDICNVFSFLCFVCTITSNAGTLDPYPSVPVGLDTPNTQGESQTIHYLGAGYNIFKGNPDGGSWSHGGDDPGALLTKKVLSIDKGNTPSQIEIGRHGCQIYHDYNLIYSSKTYQDRLRLFVQGEGGQQVPGGQYAFTLSKDYNAVYHLTELLHYVFQEYTTMCNLGDARYKLSSAMEHAFPLSDDFAISLCSLPEQYSQKTYMAFLETWGTHVITEVVYGKRATKRYRTKLSEYFRYLLHHVGDDISEGGPLWGFQSSLMVDMDSYQYRPEFKDLIGSLQQEMVSSGTNFYDNNKLVLTPLDSIISRIKREFWQSFQSIAGCANKTSSVIQTWATNIGQAISEYPIYYDANAPKDTNLQIPLTWPNGTYTLQKTNSGCPGEITWVEGMRHEEMERQDPDSSWSENNHFGGLYVRSTAKVIYGREKLRKEKPGSLTNQVFDLEFCSKIQNTPTGFEMNWPQGNYCIYKHGECPAGFQSGGIFIDDEDYRNKNTHTGELPDGEFNWDTTFDYCCRSDGMYSKPIRLPNRQPFYLFKYTTECQHVEGMIATEETLRWDDEDNHHIGHEWGSHPAVSSDGYMVTIYYCYYEPVNQMQLGTIIGK